MKILESYKKIVKSMLIEHAWDRKFGESLPTLEDVMNEADVMSHVIKYKDEDGNEKEISVKSALQAGESHPAYKQASDIADKGQAGLAQKDKEEPKAKGFEPDDFERDFDDSEPDDDPTRTDDDPDSEFGKDYMSKFIGTDEPEDDDEEEESIIVINGKKYKPVKEEKKATEKHILRENYERFGGK